MIPSVNMLLITNVRVTKMSRLSITFLKQNVSPQMGLGGPRVEFHSPAHGLSAAM